MWITYIGLGFPSCFLEVCSNIFGLMRRRNHGRPMVNLADDRLPGFFLPDSGRLISLRARFNSFLVHHFRYFDLADNPQVIYDLKLSDLLKSATRQGNYAEWLR